MELHRVTRQRDDALHSQAVRIGNLEAQLSGVALPEERQSQQNNTEVKQPAQGRLEWGILMIPADRAGLITKGIPEQRPYRVFLQTVDTPVTKQDPRSGNFLSDPRRGGPSFPHRIADFRPSVTGRAWGKTGARTAGGAGARCDFVQLPIDIAVACLSTGQSPLLTFLFQFNCYNFDVSSRSIAETIKRHEMSFLRICE